MGKTGYDYAPSSRTLPPAVGPGEFVFSVVGLDHGHIFGQTNGLIEAGGTLKHVHDPDPAKVEEFLRRYPQARPAGSLERILEDEETHCVASACVPCERGPLGVRALEAGKHYFVDKAPFTDPAHLEAARRAVAATGRRYMVYYSERLHNEASVRATGLIREGAVGEVVQVLNLAPHRLSKEARPDWFFDKGKTGGILVDIGSHQFEQFLAFTGARDAKLHFARAANMAHPELPGFEDFGEASLTTDTGASCYCRVDWLTPGGLRVWGDGRVFVVGTAGSMEIRKYTDLARPGPGNRILLVDGAGEREIECEGAVGFPFFGEMILDLLEGTERAMTQEHIFKAAELSLRAQALADGAEAGGGAT